MCCSIAIIALSMYLHGILLYQEFCPHKIPVALPTAYVSNQLNDQDSALSSV